MQDAMFKCHMYWETIPNKKDAVVITYKEIRPDEGIIVTLNEYDNIDAIIYFPEFTRQKRIKSYSSLCHIGHIDVAEVIDVDINKRYVSLSKKYLADDDVKQYLEYYELNRKLQTIMKKICIKLKIPLISIYESFVWDLFKWFQENNEIEQQHEINSDTEGENDTTGLDDYENKPLFIKTNLQLLKSLDKNWHHPYIMFNNKDTCNNLKSIDEISENILKIINDNHVDYFGKNIEKVCLEFKFNSFSMDAVTVIKEQLKKIQDLANTYSNIKLVEMLLNQSPIYKITITTDDKNIIPEFIEKLKELFIPITTKQSGLFNFIKSIDI